MRFQTLHQSLLNVRVCSCDSTGGQIADWRVAAGTSSYVVKPRRDPLRVRGGEQLFGRLAELQDLCQHADSLVGVLNAFRTIGKLAP